MKLSEYNKVKDMTYLKYCDYLQDKYGIGLADYMSKNFTKNKKVSRAKEGLIAHHKMENRMPILSNKEIAQLCPFEWQRKENIIYCDYLEHLLLHVLICKYPFDKESEALNVGIIGILRFIVPELNDVYSGWITAQDWRRKCHEKIINDKEVYLSILKQFVEIELLKKKKFDIKMLATSMNASFGTWNIKNNKKLFKEISDALKETYLNAAQVIFSQDH